MNKTALQTKDLYKIYQVGDQKVEALRGVNLSVEEGKFIALTGTSGSGKSTLMHCLGGLDMPTSGEVIIDGVDLCACREKQLAKVRSEKIGFVFQNFSLLDELSVRENIALPMMLAGKKPDREYLEKLMDQLGILERQDHTPTQLSGGQQQRVAIARALVNNPAVILCDEPTGNLDQKTSGEVMELLHRIHREFHKTCLIVTHDMHVAEGADYILEMEDGLIKQ